jgi:hypothetical protein
MSIIEAEILASESDEHIVTESQHQDECDANEGSNLSKDYGCFNPGSSSSNNYDLALDLNIGRKQIQVEEEVEAEWTDDEFRNLVQKLNEKQKEFFLPCS